MRSHLHPLRITDIVESERVTDLRVQHCDGAAPRRERAGASRRPGFPRELRRQIGRYEYDDGLAQHDSVSPLFLCFSHPASGWYNTRSRVAFFSQIIRLCGMLLILTHANIKHIKR